jgi:hypothetical protein
MLAPCFFKSTVNNLVNTGCHTTYTKSLVFTLEHTWSTKPNMLVDGGSEWESAGFRGVI